VNDLLGHAPQSSRTQVLPSNGKTITPGPHHPSMAVRYLLALETTFWRMSAPQAGFNRRPIPHSDARRRKSVVASERPGGVGIGRSRVGRALLVRDNPGRKWAGGRPPGSTNGPGLLFGSRERSCFWAAFFTQRSRERTEESDRHVFTLTGLQVDLDDRHFENNSG
jgi:hypothetical protein